jgi:hypothetical protein
MEENITERDPLKGIMHCPVCGRELEEASGTEEGWDCRCGEFIPRSLSINSFEGCTHGLNCNCNRKMKR